MVLKIKSEFLEMIIEKELSDDDIIIATVIVKARIWLFIPHNTEQVMGYLV